VPSAEQPAVESAPLESPPAESTESPAGESPAGDSLAGDSAPVASAPVESVPGDEQPTSDQPTIDRPALRSEATTPAPPSARPFDHPEGCDESAARVDASLPTSWRARLRRQPWLAAFLLPVLLLGAFGVDRALHRHHVMRGVRVAGIDLGGLDRAAAERALIKLDSDLRGAPIPVLVRQTSFTLLPDDVGLSLDVQDLVDGAMAAGRDDHLLAQLGFWLARFMSPHELAPVAKADDSALASRFDAWAEEAISDPPFEGAVVVKNGEPRAEAPRRGWIIDRDAGRAALVVSFASSPRETVTMPLLDRPPLRTAGMVEAQVEEARRLLSREVVLLADPPDDAPKQGKQGAPAAPPTPARAEGQAAPSGLPAKLRFVVSRTMLGQALRSVLVDEPRADLRLDFDPRALEPVLDKARKELERPPRDATFEVDDKDRISVRPSRAALKIDPVAVATRVLELARGPVREGPMPISDGEPAKFTTADAEALGITGVVSQFTTSYPCCRPRVQNIHRIAELIDGVVVKPGERFSINDHVGERTAAKGFHAAPTIVHGDMEDTLGGGVSQFATTFFNAFFHGGYEIVERQPHSFYFRRYPMGHEATLSYPKPDVIIRNDTDAGLLIRCIATPTTITIKLYGNNGGRKVTPKVTAPQDITQPPNEYIADRSLDPDDEKVKDRGAQGWTVIVSRITEYPDGKKRTESRKVTYQPRPRKLRVHPCRIPRGEKGYTGEPCPEPREDDGDERADGAAPASPDELESSAPMDPELTPEG
jgi:vancomycin resistance protein YoaR